MTRTEAPERGDSTRDKPYAADESRGAVTALAERIRTALQPVLHVDQQHLLMAVARLLSATAHGRVAPRMAGARLTANPTLREALRRVVGQVVAVDGGSITFGDDVITLGDLTDNRAVAIGRGAIAIYVGYDEGLMRAQEERNRPMMCERVKTCWVKGILEPSLSGGTLVELGATFFPDIAPVAGRERNTLTSMPGATDWTVAAAADFVQAGSGLLILGAPGAGKTTVLIDLAGRLLDVCKEDLFSPIPVIFNLAIWSHESLPLRDWLILELNKRYGVPRRQGAVWVDNDQIVPLLDGLDEVPGPYRAACVEAINGFRGEHGMGGLVVCARTEEYQALVREQHVRLHLNGAMVIRPLTERQIEAYLASGGQAGATLRVSLQQDCELRELAASPLMLSLMTRIHQGDATAPRSPASPEERRSLLFAAYTRRMLSRAPALPFTPSQTRRWLALLAGEMSKHSISIFYPDRLQPDVLDTPLLRLQYALIDRMGVGLACGISFGLFANLVCTQVFAHVLESDASWSSAIGSVNLLVFLAVFAAIGGLFGGRSEHPPKRPHGLWWLSRGAILGWLLVCLVAAAAAGRAVIPFLDLGAPSMWELAFGITTGLLGLLAGGLTGAPGVAPRRIAVVETFGWSWQEGLALLPVALLSGLMYGVIYILLVGTLVPAFVAAHSAVLLAMGLILGVVVGLIVGVVSWVAGGLEGNVLGERLYPNQGIWRSARSGAVSCLAVGLIMAPVVGLGVGLFFYLANVLFGAPATVASERALANGLVFGAIYSAGVGLIVGLIFGGYACLSHLALRVVLWGNDMIPWRLVRFLDHGVECGLLRNVGGGYLFIHRLLQEYVVGLDDVKGAHHEQRSSGKG